VRLGVGRPIISTDVVDHVLNGFAADEKQALDEFLERACEAIVTILTNGILEGMNRFNRNPR
jgi:PTH1 family peptidyl-tRNA hydrolase